MNESYRMILVISIPNETNFRSLGGILHQKTFGNKQEVNDIVQHAVDEIIPQETEKENLSVKNETHENIDYEVDEDERYDMDTLSLYKNKWRKRASERKIKYIYDIKILNSMKHINDNEVNNIAEWNLLHDILNPYKHTKNINSHYNPIIHGSLNTYKGRENLRAFEYYWIVDVVPQLWWEC